MTYRMIAALLLCFMLVSCAGTPLPAAPDEEPWDTSAMPETFLGSWGYWHDGEFIYSTFYRFLPDGKMEVREFEGNDLRLDDGYKVVYAESPRSVYILRRQTPLETNTNGTYVYYFMHLYAVDYDPDQVKKPEYIDLVHLCKTNESEWGSPPSQLAKRILEYDLYQCDIRANWPHANYHPYRRLSDH